MGTGLRTAARLARTQGWRTGADYAARRPLIRFTHNNHRYVLARDSSTEYHLRESTPKLARLAATVTGEDRYVLDVGAHSGLFAAMVLNQHPSAQVACIEPDDTLRSALDANLRGRATIYAEAAGDHTGEATLWRLASSTQASSLHEDAARAYGDPVPVKVPVTTIDTIVTNLGWPRVDVLKLDIQGAEAEALDGAKSTLPGVRALLIEVSFLDHDPAGMLRRLRDEFDSEPTRLNPVHMGADLMYRR